MREPQFWDDEALHACGVIFATDLKEEGLLTGIDGLRRAFDNFSGLYYDQNRGHEYADVVSAQWRILGAHAIAISEQRGIVFTPNSVTETLIRKQRDYGHENIRRFGRTGLIIRCHDKIARLENLCGSDFEPNNESIDDTLLDIVGYSAIGIMWEAQTFLLPLAPPKNSSELLARGVETR
jgi:hypothetical protein